MLKKFTKFLLIMLVVFVISFSSQICFADEEHDHDHTDTATTTETNEETESTDDTTTSSEIETHSGDLYLFDSKIVMDKYVDGNVFLFGDNIEITGRVNGNLFVFGDNVKFNESIVRYSIFACANSLYYNGGCGTSSDYGNLYVAASNFESTYNSYVTGDVKAVASKIILKSAVYRNVNLLSNTVNFGEGSDISLIYGNINYTAINEVELPEGVLGSTDASITYTKPSELNNPTITEILIGFGVCIVTVLSVYIILKKLTPKFVENYVCTNNFSIISILKGLGIGLATIVIVPMLVLILAVTSVGIILAVILALLFSIFCIIATPILTIKITNALKPALRIEKDSMFYLVIGLVSIILHGITLIPYIGLVLDLIINITAIGLIVTLYLPHKELSNEEKLALEEAKKQAKEDKEKRKQEKLEAKANKKTKNDKTIKEKTKKTKKKNKEN